MSQTRIGSAYPNRDTFRDRIGNCEDVEQLSNVVRDLVHAVSFRSEVNDTTGRSKIVLSGDPGSGGSQVVVRTVAHPTGVATGMTGTITPPVPSAPAYGAINQGVPQVDPVTKTAVPGITLAIRTFNNFDFNTGVTTLDAVAYAPQTPQQEILLKTDIGGQTLYGRIPLMANPDEGVGRPLLGWGGANATIPYATVDSFAKCTADFYALSCQCKALKQMVVDLAQSILKYGLIRPTYRTVGTGSPGSALSDTVNFGEPSGPG
jgi:hypothetical protein